MCPHGAHTYNNNGCPFTFILSSSNKIQQHMNLLRNCKINICSNQPKKKKKNPTFRRIKNLPLKSLLFPIIKVKKIRIPSFSPHKSWILSPYFIDNCIRDLISKFVSTFLKFWLFPTLNQPNLQNYP